MPLRAAAFHQTVPVSRLDQLFRSAEKQMFAGTTDILCPRCQARFAVFFTDRDDPDHAVYLARIRWLISEFCEDGKHNQEVIVSE